MLYVDTRRNKFQFRKIQQRIVCIESLMCPQWCFVFFFFDMQHWKWFQRHIVSEKERWEIPHTSSYGGMPPFKPEITPAWLTRCCSSKALISCAFPFFFIHRFVVRKDGKFMGFILFLKKKDYERTIKKKLLLEEERKEIILVDHFCVFLSGLLQAFAFHPPSVLWIIYKRKIWKASLSKE